MRTANIMVAKNGCVITFTNLSILLMKSYLQLQVLQCVLFLVKAILWNLIKNQILVILVLILVFVLF